MEKIAYVYNKFYNTFLEEVVEGLKPEADAGVVDTLTKAKDHGAKRSATSVRNIERFVKKLHIVVETLDSANSTEPSSLEHLHTIELVKGITLDVIISVTSEEYAKCYLYLFATLAHLYSVESAKDSDEDSDGESDNEGDHDNDTSCVGKVLDIIKDLQNGTPVDIKFDDQVLAKLLENLSKVIAPITTREEAVPNISSTPEFLANTKIGNLAKEISEEIDINSLNIENPADLLKGGFSGENSAFSDIISKVGKKIHQKIDNGELKQEDLMSEAMSMLSSLGGQGGGGLFDNPMLKDMMKNMGNLSGVANMMKNSDKAKSASTKDRLRRKLDEKRKNL